MKLSLFVLSVTDVAVMVGDAFGAAGTLGGGMYSAPKLGVELDVSEPQAGAQFAPPAVKVQVTPAFAESFETVALIVTVGPPAG